MRSSLMAVHMLQLASFTIVFYSMSTLTNGIFYVTGPHEDPVQNAFIALLWSGSRSRFSLMYFEKMGIYGILVSNIAYSVIMTGINSYSIRKTYAISAGTENSYAASVCLGMMGVAVYFVIRECIS